MANFFTLQDGILTDSSVYGISLSSSDIFDNTTGTMILTSSRYLNNVTNTNGDTISAISFNLSSRSTNPVGTLDLTVSRTANLNTFIDSSPNNHKLTTSNVNSFQTTFSPFSPNGWSGYFNGTTHGYLRTSNPMVFGTSDFTIELWVQFHGLTTNRLLCESWAASVGWQLYWRTTGTSIAFLVAGSVVVLQDPTATTIKIGDWYHIAVSRSSGVLRLFINGILVDSVSYATSIAPTANFNIGSQFSTSTNWFGGNISNLRIVNNQAIYTTNFTPPTAKLGLTHNGGAVGATATPLSNNVAILTLQDNRFKDNSTNNYSLTASTPIIKDETPFAPITMNPVIHGGSGYFGNSVLSLPSTSSPSLSFGTGDFTVEFWIYPVTNLAQYEAVCAGSKNDSFSIQTQVANDNKLCVTTTIAGILNSTTPLVLNQWNHFAASRSSGKLLLYVNGLSSAQSVGNTTNFSDISFVAGQNNTAHYLKNSYLSNFRAIKGTALYTTASFTPSSTPLNNIPNTSLLLNTNYIGVQSSASETYPISSFTSFDGSANSLTNHPQNWQILKLTNPLTANTNDIFLYNLKTSNANQLSLIGTEKATPSDKSFTTSVTIVGSPAVESFKPYQNFEDSFYLSNTDRFTGGANTKFSLSGDFTIETWINTSVFTTDASVSRRIFTFGVDGVNTISLNFWTGTADTPNLGVYTSSTRIAGTIPVADGQWHHIALSRYSGVIKLYVDGLQSGDSYFNANIFSNGATSPLTIGAYNNSNSGRINGYINQFRIVNGTALYTGSSFTPPSEPLRYIPNTVFLLKPQNRVNNATISNKAFSSGSLVSTNLSLSSTSPFGAGTGSSIYFNTSTSNILIPSSNWFSKDFTVELWMYWTGGTGQNTLINNSVGINIFLDLGSNWGIADNSAVHNNFGTPPIKNRWNHLVISRIGTSIRAFINGSQVFEGTNSNTYAATQFNIGASSVGNFNGYIYDLRIVNQAVYTPVLSTIPVPTKTLEATLGTTLLINSSTYNSSTYNYVEPIDNIHIGGSLKGLTTESRSITSDTCTIPNLYIHKNGTLTFPSNKNTTLTLINSAGLQITQEGTLNIGTSASVIPLSTTHTLVLSNTQIDVHNGANLNVYGFPKTISTNLVNDTLSGSRSFTTTNSVSTSWLSGDTLSFKPNLINRTGFDELILSSFTDNNTFTTTSSSVFTHTGSATYGQIPAVYNLSRNINIQGLSVTSRGTIRTIDKANTNINYTRLSNIGGFKSNSIILSNNSNGSSVLSGNVLMNDLSSYPIIFNNDENTKKASMYLNGSSSISLPYNVAYANFGTSDFTIEGWFNTTNNTNTQQSILANITSSTGWSNGAIFYIYLLPSKLLTARIGDDAPSTSISHQTVIQSNTWYHFAVVRNSGYVQLYVNGIPSNTPAMLKNENLTNSNPVYIGVNPGVPNLGTLYYFTGFLSNFRILKGEAKYTSQFNPYNTFPSSVIPNTTLLLFQDFNNTDKSSTNATLNEVGDPTLVRISPYGIIKNTKISNNIIYRPINKSGLSLYFTGGIENTNITNNHILSSSVVGFDISYSSGSINMSGNTVVGSLSVGTQVQYSVLTGTYGALNYNTNLQGMMIAETNTGTIIGGGINALREGVYVNSSIDNLSGLSFKNIIVGNNSSVGFKVSGNSLDYLNPITLNINGLTASNNSDSGFEGYNITGNLSSVVANNNYGYGIETSIGNGSTNFDSISVLNTSFDSSIKTVTKFGNPVLSSASPFGSGVDGSISFNGTTDYITVANTSDLNLGTSDFTIECWVYHRSRAANNTFLSKRVAYAPTASGFHFYIATTGIVQWLFANTANTGWGAALNATGLVIPLNTWTHIAAVRRGNTVYGFVNGLSANTNGSAAYTDSCTSTGPILIGTSDNTSFNEKFNGLISNIRIVKGTALYTSNFDTTLPVSPATPVRLVPNTSLLYSYPYSTSYFTASSIMCGINILSGYNYGNFTIKNSLISSYNPDGIIDYGIVLDSTRFSNFCLDNSVLSTTTPLQLNVSRNLLEGSYLINNSILGSTPLGTGITSKYQPYAIRSTGFAFTNINKIQGSNITYYAHGERATDTSVANNIAEYPSERLTPYSSSSKIRSGSKFVALDKDDSTIIRVNVRKSISTGGETKYNGNPPRLILNRNPSVGVYSDVILDQLTTINDISGSFIQLVGATQTVNNNGVLEFYIDCDGTQGWINIDNWEAS